MVLINDFQIKTLGAKSFLCPLSSEKLDPVFQNVFPSRTLHIKSLNIVFNFMSLGIHFRHLKHNLLKL